MDKKITVVIGASPNPSRYSNLAVKRLKSQGHDVIPIGIKKGDIEGTAIVIGTPEVKNADTITLYLNSERQRQYYHYVLSLKPKRIIFNPGAENPELEMMAREKGIESLEACTLVLLSTGQY
jgi:uncharacterized protein